MKMGEKKRHIIKGNLRVKAIMFFLAFALSFSVLLSVYSGFANPGTTLTVPADSAVLAGPKLARAINFTATVDAVPIAQSKNVTFYYLNVGSWTYVCHMTNTIDAQTNFNCSNISAIADGTYTFNATYWNNNGDGTFTYNESDTSASVKVDNTAPTAAYESITPADGSSFSNNLSINVSASDALAGLDNLSIYVNGTIVKSCSSSPCFWTNNSPIGSYMFNATINDTVNNTNYLSSRTISIVADATVPTITTSSIYPRIVITGKPIELGINATDNVALHNVFASINLPDNSVQTVSLVNNGKANFTTSQQGAHNVTFFANDTAGNKANSTNSFISEESFSFNVSIFDYNKTGTSSSLTAYVPDTTDEIAFYSSSGGQIFNKVLANTTYDLMFKAYDDGIKLILKNTSFTYNLNKSMYIDKLPDPSSGYERTYAIQTDYVIQTARLEIKYGTYFPSDESLSVYKCSNWNFTNRSCYNGEWAELGSNNVYQNKIDKYFRVNTTSFSAFKVKQARYCGDGYCDVNENATNCSVDCALTIVPICSNNAIIPSSGCKCNSTKYTSGYCCNNTYSTISCALGQGEETIPLCLEGEIPLSGCSCNNTNYTSGYCCDGTYQTTACTVVCSDGLIPSTGCKCGAFTRTSGYCCDGKYQTTACSATTEKKSILKYIIIALTGLVVIGGIGAVIYFNMQSKPKLASKPSITRQTVASSQEASKPKLSFSAEKVKEILEKQKATKEKSSEDEELRKKLEDISKE